MPQYYLTFNDVTLSAVANNFKTVAALICDDSAGYQVRVNSLRLASSNDVPKDVQIAVRFMRIDDFSAGTSGAGTSIAMAAVPKADSLATNSLARGRTGFTTEPTTYATQPLWQGEFNARGQLVREWADNDPQAPCIRRDQIGGLLATPRVAESVSVSGTIGFQLL